MTGKTRTHALRGSHVSAAATATVVGVVGGAQRMKHGTLSVLETGLFAAVALWGVSFFVVVAGVVAAPRGALYDVCVSVATADSSVAPLWYKRGRKARGRARRARARDDESPRRSAARNASRKLPVLHTQMLSRPSGPGTRAWAAGGVRMRRSEGVPSEAGAARRVRCCGNARCCRCCCVAVSPLFVWCCCLYCRCTQGRRAGDRQSGGLRGSLCHVWPGRRRRRQRRRSPPSFLFAQGRGDGDSDHALSSVATRPAPVRGAAVAVDHTMCGDLPYNHSVSRPIASTRRRARCSGDLSGSAFVRETLETRTHTSQSHPYSEESGCVGRPAASSRERPRGQRPRKRWAPLRRGVVLGVSLQLFFVSCARDTVPGRPPAAPRGANRLAERRAKQVLPGTGPVVTEVAPVHNRRRK